jgi:serine/threonine protein kinase
VLQHQHCSTRWLCIEWPALTGPLVCLCFTTRSDLKPGNVLLAESRLDARGFEAQLSDFGLSAIAGTLNKPAMGTAQFTAPEVFEKQTSTPASDIYSFGILLFEMIAGRAAYEGMTMRESHGRGGGAACHVGEANWDPSFVQLQHGSTATAVWLRVVRLCMIVSTHAF